MADERRTNMLQDAFNQTARLSGVSLNENRPMNPSSNEPASNSVGMEPLSFAQCFYYVVELLRLYHKLSQQGHIFSLKFNNKPGWSEKKTEVDKASKVIYKDLVLIPDPDEKQVPTHNPRVTLETDGKIIHGFPVDVEWDAKSLRMINMRSDSRSSVF